MSKYDALATLGMGLMQWGANRNQQQLQREAMIHERERNARLDALAERRVVNEENRTSADMARSEVELEQLRFNQGLIEKFGEREAKAKVEGLEAGVDATIAGTGHTRAQTTHIGEQTRGLAIANDNDEQFGTAERALKLAGLAEEVTGRALDNDEQRIQNDLLGKYGEQQLELELDQLYFGNEKTRADVTKGKAETVLKQRELAFKEFLAGAKYDEEEGTYTLNGQPLSTKTDKLPTGVLQVAQESFMPAMAQRAHVEGMRKAQLDGHDLSDMDVKDQLKWLMNHRDKTGNPYMPTQEELMFVATDLAIRQMGAANLGAQQFQGALQWGEDRAPDATYSSPFPHVDSLLNRGGNSDVEW